MSLPRIKGLILAGYQGWFTCDGDGAHRGWSHYHNGKPLVAIGGIGWVNDVAGRNDAGYLNEAEHIIDGLIARGFSILIRVPAKWRSGGGGQVLTDPDDVERFYAILKRCDIVFFKCRKEVPIGDSPFRAYEEDVETDHYLWLAGESGKMLKGEIPYTSQLPDRVLSADNRAPYCEFLLPESIEVFPDGRFRVRVSAFDYDGAIMEVSLRVDDVLKDTHSSAPYNFAINPGAGRHTLTALAVDDDGSIRSSEIRVSVSAAGATINER